MEFWLWSHHAFHLKYAVCCTKARKLCLAFVQCWTNVEDVALTLCTWYTHVLCLLGSNGINTFRMVKSKVNVDHQGVYSPDGASIADPDNVSSHVYTPRGATGVKTVLASLLFTFPNSVWRLGRQILTSIVGPCTERIKKYTMAVDP